MQKLQNLDILRWNYRTQDPAITHIGPVAQDFYAAFNVGMDSTAISSIDPAGIALAAIKELTRTQDELTTKVQQLEDVNRQMADLREQVTELSQLVEMLLAGRTGNENVSGLTVIDGE